ncbi:uncharacterized protein LOC142061250 [Phalacrocorax aristotelis]|uniref:uncharacterized protein LOC142061250 n=1 Tax=Phalacrocorax aristotelis TaxID=126867 RepID=UPI003F4B8F5B
MTKGPEGEDADQRRTPLPCSCPFHVYQPPTRAALQRQGEMPPGLGKASHHFAQQPNSERPVRSPRGSPGQGNSIGGSLVLPTATPRPQSPYPGTAPRGRLAADPRDSPAGPPCPPPAAPAATPRAGPTLYRAGAACTALRQRARRPRADEEQRPVAEPRGAAPPGRRGDVVRWRRWRPHHVTGGLGSGDRRLDAAPAPPPPRRCHGDQRGLRPAFAGRLRAPQGLWGGAAAATPPLPPPAFSSAVPPSLRRDGAVPPCYPGPPTDRCHWPLARAALA